MPTFPQKNTIHSHPSPILVSGEEVEGLGLGEVVDKRKRKGRPILITTKWITGEIGGQAENLFNDPERNPTARPTYFESELVLAVMQCQANLTKKCSFPDHIRPFGHRKRIFGGVSVSF